MIPTTLELDPGSRVIKAKDYRRFQEAKTIIATARRQAEKILADAQNQAAKDREVERERGYREGLEAAQKEQAGTLLATINQCAQLYRQIGPELAEVVQQTVEDLIGQLSDETLTLKLIQQALSRHRCKRALIRVKPECLATVQAKIRVMQEVHPDMEYLEVRPDPSIEEAGAILETELGNIQAQLSVQLVALAKAIDSVFPPGASDLEQADEPGKR